MCFADGFFGPAQPGRLRRLRRSRYREGGRAFLAPARPAPDPELRAPIGGGGDVIRTGGRPALSSGLPSPSRPSLSLSFATTRRAAGLVSPGRPSAHAPLCSPPRRRTGAHARSSHCWVAAGCLCVGCASSHAPPLSARSPCWVAGRTASLPPSRAPRPVLAGDVIAAPHGRRMGTCRPPRAQAPLCSSPRRRTGAHARSTHGWFAARYLCLGVELRHTPLCSPPAPPVGARAGRTRSLPPGPRPRGGGT